MKDKFEKLIELSQGNYKAFLYDCDGTLADNMHAHKKSYVMVAARYGIDLDDRIIDELAGVPTLLVVEAIRERYQGNFDAQEFASAKSNLFLEEFVQKTKPVDFVYNHLLAHEGQVKIGVVSGGRRHTVSRTLEVLGLTDKVEALVCAGETENGKPFPDPFLLAASQLGVPPTECLVFEDGDPGVQSAIAAGMQWIRVDQV